MNRPDDPSSNIKDLIRARVRDLSDEFAQILNSQSPTQIFAKEDLERVTELQAKAYTCGITSLEQGDSGLMMMVAYGNQLLEYRQRHQESIITQEKDYIGGIIQNLIKISENLVSFLRTLADHPAFSPHPAQSATVVEADEQQAFFLHSEACQPETEVESCLSEDENMSSHPNAGTLEPTPPVISQTSELRKRTRDIILQREELIPPQRALTIDFEEVYQNGKAENRYVILNQEYSLSLDATVTGKWWILQCKQHDLHFAHKDFRTLQIASCHLKCHSEVKDGPFHPIELFGVLVLNCTKQLADKNNEDVQRAIANGSYEPKNRLKTNSQHIQKKRRMVKMNVPRLRKLTGQVAITSPYVGKLYLAYWRPGSTWYAAMIVPLGDFSRVGRQGSFEESGLLRDLPNCYFHDQERGIYSWTKDYKEGGSKVTGRSFPLFYFDDEDTIEDCKYGWVTTSNLKEYDINQVNQKYHPIINRFMAENHNAARIAQNPPTLFDDELSMLENVGETHTCVCENNTTNPEESQGQSEPAAQAIHESIGLLSSMNELSAAAGLHMANNVAERANDETTTNAGEGNDANHIHLHSSPALSDVQQARGQEHPVGRVALGSEEAALLGSATEMRSRNQSHMVREISSASKTSISNPQGNSATGASINFTGTVGQRTQNISITLPPAVTNQAEVHHPNIQEAQNPDYLPEGPFIPSQNFYLTNEMQTEYLDHIPGFSHTWQGS